ncbi:hypothetical protein EJ08DRAFT_122991 [Tothia fuscella]|uniref:Thioesterase domain-containing protein n=1 Tax=Tothia fuscella TaxID=1048955 RepID=A0A9P4NVW6_9PEZI|nr:hypothetical protein EJ08DRAFT_122991 [Tothia fuscella]
MVVHQPTHFRRPSDRDYKVPPEVLAKLQQTEWCLDTVNDRSFRPIHSFSRDPPPHLNGRYSFIGKTMKTESTVPLWQAFYRPSNGTVPAELRVIAELGEGGLDGHLHTAHGGVTASLIDEALGSLAGIHKTPGKSIFTAYMKIDYKKPVPTPSTVLFRVKLNGKSAARKIYCDAWLENGQDGAVYTTAESLFLETERKHHGPEAKL